MVVVTRTVAGTHAGAYSFTNEVENETEPTGWTNIDAGTCVSSIQESFRGHLKILDSADTDAVNNAGLYHAFAAAHDSGIAEFYGTVSGQNQWTYYTLYNDTNTKTLCNVYFLGTATGFNVKNAVGTTLNGSEYQHGQWVHVAICFNNSGGALDCGDGENLDDGKYRVYLNGVKINDYALVQADDAEWFIISTNTTPP